MAVSKRVLQRLRAIIKNPSGHGITFSAEEQNALKCYNVDSDHYLNLFMKERSGMANRWLTLAKIAA